jgi:hypothetical protein
MLAFVWALSILMVPADGLRQMPNQLSQAGATVFATFVPWFAGGLALSIAALSAGADPASFDLAELACRHFSTPWLAGILGCAGLASLVPTLAIGRPAIGVGVQELLPGLKSRRWLAAGEWLFFVAGLALAAVAHLASLDIVRGEILAIGALAVVYVLIGTDFYAVRRARLVLDDLYSEGGIFRGVFGFTFSGWLSLGAGVAAAIYAHEKHLDAGSLCVLAIAAAAAGQIVFGNVERMILERR